jgi:hypothetical protein
VEIYLINSGPFSNETARHFSGACLAAKVTTVLAKRLEDGIKDDIYGENGWLSRRNNSNPRPAVPSKFYDLTLTAADGPGQFVR